MRSLLLILALIPLGLGFQVSPKERMESFLTAFNSKDRAKVKAMLEANLAPAMFERRKLEEWVDQTMQIANDLAPLQVEKVLLERSTAIVVQVKAGNGETLGMRFDFEPKASPKIVGLQIHPDANSLLETRKVVDHSAYTDLEDLARRIVESAKVPAMGVATWKDGKSEVGVSGLRKAGAEEKVQRGDLWLIGSIGKPMTSSLVATYIEEGKLNWDSKLGDVLKDIPMRDEYKAVTVEQLMQHIAGIPQDMRFTGLDVARIMGDLKDPVAIRAAYMKDILSRAPIGKPGEKMAYSNAGYSILGHIAERLGKKPFPILIKERLFDPLGMSTAICGYPGEAGMPGGANQPSGHFEMPSGPRPGRIGRDLVDITVPAGGGFACSVEDLAKFGVWHLRGILGEKTPVLRSETIKRLHTTLPRTAGGERYASGWVLDGDMHTHNGSDGTFNAEIALFPEKKLVVVGIANMGFEKAPTPGEEAVRAVLQKNK